MNEPMSDRLDVGHLFHEVDRRLVASLRRCSRSRVHCRESKCLVTVSRAGLTRGRLLLERAKARIDG